MEKEQQTFDEINLSGFKIHIFEDKIKIFNHKNTPFKEFKSTSDKLVQYMMDEMFIPKEKLKIEIITD